MELHEISEACAVSDTLPTEDLPNIVPNSELQLDGDISCYYNAWPEQALATDIENLKRHIEAKRLLAGCEVVRVHTTNGSKAGREDIAQVQEYQATRKVADPEKKARVEQLRTFLSTYSSPTVIPEASWHIEADDAMNIRQRQLMSDNRISKIMTVDKDLDMCPGIHIHYDTLNEQVHPDGYGKLWIVETGTLKSKGGDGIKRKVKGNGTGFFWLQLLMGDKADHIPGLPRIPGEYLNKVKPLVSAEKTLKTSKSKAAKERARKRIAERKSAPVGQILAYEILKGCSTNKDALPRVAHAYKAHYGVTNFNFVSWRGKKLTLTFADMLVEQARLLWMLRSPNDHVKNFFNEIGKSK